MIEFSLSLSKWVSYVLGDISGGEQAVARASELGGADCASSERRALESLRRLHEDAQRAMEAGDHRRVVFCMDRCLDYSPSCSRYVHILNLKWLSIQQFCGFLTFTLSMHDKVTI